MCYYSTYNRFVIVQVYANTDPLSVPSSRKTSQDLSIEVLKLQRLFRQPEIKDMGKNYIRPGRDMNTMEYMERRVLSRVPLTPHDIFFLLSFFFTAPRCQIP